MSSPAALQLGAGDSCLFPTLSNDGLATFQLTGLKQVNFVVVLACLFMHITISNVYYFAIFHKRFSHLVYGREQLPKDPLTSVLTTIVSTLLLLTLINCLAIQFRIDSWQEALNLAGVLWLIDACLNVRHYVFEHRPIQLFFLHTGYHAVTITMMCLLTALFGTPKNPALSVL